MSQFFQVLSIEWSVCVPDRFKRFELIVREEVSIITTLNCRDGLPSTVLIIMEEIGTDWSVNPSLKPFIEHCFAEKG